MFSARIPGQRSLPVSPNIHFGKGSGPNRIAGVIFHLHAGGIPMTKLCRGILYLALLALAVLPAGCGEDNVSSSVPGTDPKFSNGQDASVVIGQANFTANAANQGGTTAANTIDSPWNNPLVAGGILYLPDTKNNRVLGFNSIPTANNATADFVIGQSDFISSGLGTSSTSFFYPDDVIYDGSRFYVADNVNNRVLIYNSLPTATGAAADVAVGQTDLNSAVIGCTASGLFMPFGIFAAGGKLLVADALNNRVLIWNSIPTAHGTAADLVLGQPDFTTCTGNTGGLSAGSLQLPVDVWSDGAQVIVSDNLNKRLLIWNAFPTVNGQAADVVVGQTDMISNGAATTADGFAGASGITVDGNRLFVADVLANRVLIWNSVPTINGEAADIVLGQTDFITGTPGATSASTLDGPWGIHVYGNKAIVSDYNNHRYLIFEAQ